MEDWTYSFGPAAKADWIRQIESDLKNQPVESLYSEWWPGEPLIPLIHAEDIPAEPVRLPDHLFKDPPLIAETFHLSAGEESRLNDEILKALSLGANSLILKADHVSQHQLERCLHHVQLDMIPVSLELPAAAYVSFDTLDASFRNKMMMRIRMDDQANEEMILQMLKQGKELSRVQLCYSIGSEGNLIDLTTQRTQCIIEFLNLANKRGIHFSSSGSQIMLSGIAHPAYFIQIVQSRVLHLIWQNLTQLYPDHLVNPNACYLESVVSQREAETGDHFLIRAAMSGLAASLSGVHQLGFQTLVSKDEDGLYRRIARNIHHLLQLESGMYKSADPLAGSYAIDFHCRRWAEKIWSSLSTS